MQFRFVSALFFAVLVTFFALVNAKEVNINFLFTEIRLSLALIIFGSAAVGALIVALLGTVKHMSMLLKIKGLEKTVLIQTKELDHLKNQLPKVEMPEESKVIEAPVDENLNSI